MSSSEARVGPLVSVVVIYRNAERFLPEALESVLQQSWHHWELLLVDDGSTDGSSAIAVEISAKAGSRRVELLHHPDRTTRGMSASRNLGAANARGDYLLFLDADDALFTDTLKRCVEILDRERGVGMVFGTGVQWSSWRGEQAVEPDRLRPLGPFVDTVVEPPSLAKVWLENRAPTPATGSAMIRAEAFKEIGGYEESFPGMYEDAVFYYKAALSLPIYVTSESMLRYRRHPESCVARAESSGQFARNRPSPAEAILLDWLASYLPRTSAREELFALLKRRLRPYEHPRVERVRQFGRSQAERMREILRTQLPDRAFRRLRSIGRPSLWPPVGMVRFGSLRRTRPISRTFGAERGTPVDRYYIERFLGSHADTVRGRVLEIGDDTYTRRFGGDQVTRSDVLHYRQGQPGVTIVADLQEAPEIPSADFDCVICTQTLQYMREPLRALLTLKRILAPGGVLLLTVPGITPVVPVASAEGWYWSFTADSVGMLFREAFASTVNVESHGNVLAATAFLHGISSEELKERELNHNDPSYAVTLAVKVMR